MSDVELTASQRAILTALIDLAQDRTGSVSVEAIAAEVDRQSRTIRKQLQSLRALQLVEGTSGPDGGYEPTDTGYVAVATTDESDAAGTETAVYAPPDDATDERDDVSSSDDGTDTPTGERGDAPTPKFCTKCGAELRDRTVRNYCPECGFEF